MQGAIQTVNTKDNVKATAEIQELQDLRKLQANAYKQVLISKFKEKLSEASEQSKKIEIEFYKYFQSKESLADLKNNTDSIVIIERLAEDTKEVIRCIEELHELAIKLKENGAIFEEDFHGFIAILDDYQPKLDKCQVSLKWVLENLFWKDFLPFWEEFCLCQSNENHSNQDVLLSYSSHLQITLGKIYHSIKEPLPLIFLDIAQKTPNLLGKLALMQTNKGLYKLKSSLSCSSRDYITMFVHQKDEKIPALQQLYHQDLMRKKSEIKTAEDILCHLLLTDNINEISLEQINKIWPLTPTNFNPPLTEAEKSILDPVTQTIIAAIKFNIDQSNRYDGLYTLLENFPSKLLKKLNFRGANLDSINLKDAVSLKGVDCRGASFSSGTFFSSDLAEANFENCDFTGVYFSGVNLRKANCKKAKFVSAQFYHVDAIAANMEYADFSNAILRDGRYVGVNFAHAEMSSTSIMDTCFFFTNFESTRFTSESFLAPSYFRVPHFKYSNIDQAQGVPSTILYQAQGAPNIRSLLDGDESSSSTHKYPCISESDKFFRLQNQIFSIFKDLDLANFIFNFEDAFIFDIIKKFINEENPDDLLVLLKYFPKLKARENLSNPFHIAIELNKPLHFKVLMQNDHLSKSINSEDQNGLTPHMLALKKGRSAIVSLIESMPTYKKLPISTHTVAQQPEKTQIELSEPAPTQPLSQTSSTTENKNAKTEVQTTAKHDTGDHDILAARQEQSKQLVAKKKLVAETLGVSLGLSTAALGGATLGIALTSKITAVTALACIGKGLAVAAVVGGGAIGLAGTTAFAVGTAGMGLLLIGAICLIAYGIHRYHNREQSKEKSRNSFVLFGKTDPRDRALEQGCVVSGVVK